MKTPTCSGRSGGGGNFGVVTEFEFRLHDVWPIVQFGLFFWGHDQGGEALRLMREVIADLPRSINAIPAAASPPHRRRLCPSSTTTRWICAAADRFRRSAEHEQAWSGPCALPPLFDFVSPMPYVAVQQMLDEANAWGLYSYDKGAYFEDLTDEVIDALDRVRPP